MAIDSAYTGKTGPKLGTYIGIVKQTQTTTRSGKIAVWVPTFGGDGDDPSQWVWVRYASPYYGISNFPDTSEIVTDNTFENTRSSYGMWMNVPDIGTRVIIVFIEGNIQQGYWFACVPEISQHYMVPSIGSTQNILPDATSESLMKAYGAKSAPVVEFNGNDPNLSFSKVPYLIKKPAHKIQVNILAKQGLLADTKRGSIDSSSNRETPSGVFGISTPGRPLTDQATDDQNVQINHATPTVDHSKVRAKVVGRKGGHSFVLDDGDVFGRQRMARLRTAAGHQILMNDTDGFIYIINSSGTSWIEMAADGQILVYAKSSISVRSESDINLRADNDLNLEAGNDINIKAHNQLQEESKTHVAIASTKYHTESPMIEALASQSMKLESKATGSWLTKGDLSIRSNKVKINSDQPSSIPTSSKLVLKTHKDTILSQPLVWKSTGTLTSFLSVVPTHEPYARATVLPESVTKAPAKIATTTAGQQSTNKQKSSTCAWESDQLTPEEKEVAIKNKTIKDDGTYPSDEEAIKAAQEAKASKQVTSTSQAKSTVGTRKKITPASSSVSSTGVLSSEKSVTPKTLVPKPLSEQYAASEGYYFKQPVPSKTIGPLSEEQTRAYYAQLGYNESTHRYDIANDGGYVGKYQFGAGALIDVGYLRPGTTQAGISDPNNWVGNGKPASLEEFYANPEYQEQAIEKYTAQNYKALVSNGVITPSDSAADVAGKLQAAHLLGPTGLKKVIQGTATRNADDNGTTAQQYYERGYYAVNTLAAKVS